MQTAWHHAGVRLSLGSGQRERCPLVTRVAWQTSHPALPPAQLHKAASSMDQSDKQISVSMGLTCASINSNTTTLHTEVKYLHTFLPSVIFWSVFWISFLIFSHLNFLFYIFLHLFLFPISFIWVNVLLKLISVSCKAYISNFHLVCFILKMFFNSFSLFYFVSLFLS